MSKAAERWTLDTPETKEAYLIRQLFEGHFPTEAAAKTAVRWIPRAVSLPSVTPLPPPPLLLQVGSLKNLFGPFAATGLGMRC